MKITAQSLALLAETRYFGLLLAVVGLIIPWRAAAGQFTALAHSPTITPGHMLLLPDGRVMEQDIGGNTWQFLNPDSQGHYINGTWSNCPSMEYTRLFYGSDVLQDGRVFVDGGEDGNGGATAEIFDPQANGGAGSWTDITPPTSLLNPSIHSPVLRATNASGNQAFLDSESAVLPNGNVLVAPVGPNVRNGTLVYNPCTNGWSEGPATFSVYQDEASWVKLPDESILTIDPSTNTTERYIPSLNQWIHDETVPVTLYSSSGEIGASLLLSNGVVLYFGGTGLTEYYTPSGGTNNGTWSPGPTIPAGLVMRDAPSAMLVTGHILLTFVPTTNDAPLSIYEFDPNSKSFTLVFTDDYEISDQTSMLELPDGTVLFNDTGTNYVYQPDGSPLASGQPSIQQVSWNADGSLHLSGTLFNGISEGAMYGDDAQQDSNYPLVRFTDGSGHVTYGRTYNWSSTCVQTGSAIVTTECAVPANVYNGPGSYSLQVVANGNASAAIPFDGPVWVDFNYSSNSPQRGTFANPYSTLPQGVSAVASGGTILIKPGSSPQTMTISKPMTISAVGGSATIGN